jgi:Putative Flp pilus-assembly TadE/G-like
MLSGGGMLTPRLLVPRRRRELGSVTVFFALFLTVLLIIGSVVISVGSWYTHGRQLQTKVDSAALAGGGAWSFPCTPETDTRIASTARTFFGEHTAVGPTAIPGTYNQQVGGVEGNKLFVSLNQADWWEDAFPAADFTSPAGSVCEARSLEVKATESDSPLLWGWLPFAPDIKKRAKVELQEARALIGALPIAVRVPAPLSSAAVFFNEADGTILGVRYFDAAGGISGMPSGLEGYSTQLDGSTPLLIGSLPSKVGVAIALSFVPECAPAVAGDCFEDQGFITVNGLCNQGTRQVVTCYAGSGSWPSRDVTSGIHFMHGYETTNVSNGPPDVHGAYLENTAPPGACEANGYFNAFFTGSCSARLTVAVDLGNGANRIADNVQVSYRLVRTNNTSACDSWCPLRPIDPTATGVATYETIGTTPHPQLTAVSEQNAIAIRIRVRQNNVPGKPTCSDPTFNANCEWYHLGSGPPTTTAPNAAAILASPIQRAYMGDLDKNGPVKWIRVNKDTNCDRNAEVSDGAAATHPQGSASCYFVDMGLKGGLAKDQDEEPFAFLEGSGPSQLGLLDCKQTLQLKDAVVEGCNQWYAKNSFTTTPVCPDPNQYFAEPPPPPFDDWPPKDCVKTQTTSAGNQLIDGLEERLFGDSTNPSCPADDPGEYVRGRNYWHRMNNQYDGTTFAWNLDTSSPLDDQANKLNPNDPRLVTLFYTPYDSQIGSGNTTWPIVNLGYFYITGFARVTGSGSFQDTDPCSDGNGLEVGAGNTPPADLNTSGAISGGAAIWGHFVKPLVQNAGSLGGTGNPCDANSSNPCVAVLTE